MIEVYAFLAAFTGQILAMSVLYPAWLIKYWRVKAASIPAERLAQLYPGVDFSVPQERFFSRYRALNTGIAVLGLLLLGWLFSYTRRPDWNDGPVEMLVGGYFMVQGLVPIGLMLWLGFKYNKMHRAALLERKRKASLQRRGLFDFVSPTIVLLTGLGYFLFAAFVIHIEQRPFAGFAGYVNIAIVTLVYAFNAFVVYRTLYGKKRNPLETHEGHAHTIALTVKSCVYSCLAVVVFLSLIFTLKLLELETWEPFALSVFLVTCALLSVMSVTAPPRQPDNDGLDHHPSITNH